MTSVIYFLPDVNTELGYREVAEDAWPQEPGPDYVPPEFVRLVCDGVDVDTAAYLADDGLPVCDDPPEFAEDDGVVVEWIGMYEAMV